MVSSLEYQHPHYPDGTKQHMRARLYEEKDLKKYSFALMRNPLHRMVSWFFFHKQTCMGEEKKFYNYDSFQDWFDDGCKTHWDDCWSMKDWITDENGKTIVDDIFLLEDVVKPNSDHWNALKYKLQASQELKFPHKMISKHEPCEKYLDKSRHQKASDICKEDIAFLVEKNL